MTRNIRHVAGPVNRQAAQPAAGTSHDARMSTKSPEDLWVGARIRAHLRQQMKDRGIDRAELARRIKADNGNTTRILNGERVPGAGQLLRICWGLNLTATRLLEENPPTVYFEGEPVPPVKSPTPTPPPRPAPRAKK